MTRTTIKTLAALALVFSGATTAKAATVNFSHLEVVLAEPDNADAIMKASWTTWFTQVYEYNLPFIEIENTTDSALEQFTMTIGDTDFQFSNEFLNKEFTNSFPFEANGEYAIAGFSTPDVEFTSSIVDNGDTLVVDFGDGGLQPGEVVRFQVDINADSNGPDVFMFPNFTEVFFNNDDGADNPVDNSLLTFLYADIEDPVSAELPDPEISSEVSQFFSTPRPHSVMQQVPIFPDVTVDPNPIPEPSAGLLALLAAASLTSRRRGA